MLSLFLIANTGISANVKTEFKPLKESVCITEKYTTIDANVIVFQNPGEVKEIETKEIYITQIKHVSNMLDYSENRLANYNSTKNISTDQKSYLIKEEGKDFKYDKSNLKLCFRRQLKC